MKKEVFIYFLVVPLFFLSACKKKEESESSKTKAHCIYKEDNNGNRTFIKCIEGTTQDAVQWIRDNPNSGADIAIEKENCSDC